jgi:hypothetical protein
MNKMSMIWKIAITLVAFFLALGIASVAFDFFLGHRYPAWTVVATLVIISPVVFMLWRDMLS